jgi:hypothetical protein
MDLLMRICSWICKSGSVQKDYNANFLGGWMNALFSKLVDFFLDFGFAWFFFFGLMDLPKREIKN